MIRLLIATVSILAGITLHAWYEQSATAHRAMFWLWTRDVRAERKAHLGR